MNEVTDVQSLRNAVEELRQQVERLSSSVERAVMPLRRMDSGLKCTKQAVIEQCARIVEAYAKEYPELNSDIGHIQGMAARIRDLLEQV